MPPGPSSPSRRSGRCWEIRRSPCRNSQANCNRDRERDGYDKEVTPAHNRDGGKGKGERPRGSAHERQRRYRKATQLPGQDGGEEVEKSCGKSGSYEEVPICAVESLDIEVNGPHRADESID